MRYTASILIITVFIILKSCATDYKRAPYGGPEDRTSPVVVSSSIRDNALNVDKNITLKIEFSKFIDRNSARNAINISPRSALKRSKVLWYDRSVKVSFKDLDDDRTVVLTLNPSLKDLRGNTLENPYTLSFSTGGRIDRKTISGRIKGALDGNRIISINNSAVKINLYDISEGDSIDYSRAEPEYSTGVSTGGKFELRNLSSGIYKLVAFTDINNDSRPQFETETAAFVPGTTDLDSNDSLSYEFALGWNDVVPPYIKNTSLAANDIIKIDFSEEIGKTTGTVDSIYINDVPADYKEYFDEPGRKTSYIRTAKLKYGDTAKIILGGIQDGYGNTIRDGFRTKRHVVTDTVPDTEFRITGRIPPRIAADGEMVFTTLSFSNDSLSIQMLNLRDSSVTGIKNDGKLLPFRYSADLSGSGIKQGDYELIFLWGEKLIQKTKITVNEEAGYGSVSGEVYGPECGKAVLVFHNTATNFSHTFSSSQGAYRHELRPGKYICAAFEDCDGTGMFGMNIEKDIMQRSVFLKDTVLIRKNWESTDVYFDLTE